MTNNISWEDVISTMPLIAIVRGIQPREALAVAEALSSAGFLCVEVPLNSPDALNSVGEIRARFNGKLLIGAGTVLTASEVAYAHEAGAQFVVSPNADPQVIIATKTLGMVSVPGFATATEAFTARDAGADALKLFPAETTSLTVLRALKAVLPPSLPILPVGGIIARRMKPYITAGAAGFGIGSSIYRPGTRPDVVRERAAGFVAAWRAYQKERELPALRRAYGIESRWR